VVLPKLTINQIKIFSFILSFLLLLLLSWNSVSNPDGILYMRAVDSTLRDGWKSAITFFNWPFYVWSLTIVAKLFHLSANGAALAFNALACGFLAIAFLQLMQSLELPEDKFIWAALVFLFFPGLNVQRDAILRDFAYWACYLFALSHLIFFNKYLKGKHAFYWSVFILGAALYRLEAVVMLTLLPLSVVWSHRQDGQWMRTLVHLYALPLFAVILAMVYYFTTHQSIEVLRLANFVGYFDYFLNGWSVELVDKANGVARAFSNVLPLEFGLGFLFGGLAFFIFLISLRAFSLETAILWLWGYRKQSGTLPASAQAPIRFAIFLNLMIVATFALYNGFLAERFLMGYLLLLCAFLPFYLPAIWENIISASRSRSSKIIQSTFFILLCSTAAVDGTISFGHTKTYLKDAAQWIQENTPVNAIVYSSNLQVDYYAHRQGRHWNDNFTDEQALSDLSNQGWRKYDFIAMRVRGNNPELRQQMAEIIPTNPIFKTTNERGDGVWVFDVRGL
jgi:hypothetical protein